MIIQSYFLKKIIRRFYLKGGIRREKPLLMKKDNP